MNLGFRQHAVCTTQATSDPHGGQQYPVTAGLTFAAITPVVAIYAPGDPVALLACRPNWNGTWTATFWSPQATTFDVYIFDQMAACPPSGSTCGFQAFNAQGALIADSAIPFLNVLGFVSGALSGTTAYTQQWSFGVAKAATVVGVTGHKYVSQGLTVPAQDLGRTVAMISAWKHAGGTVQMAASLALSNVFPLTNPILEWAYPNWTGIIVDVSNL
ncbi:hypothetical protein WK72_14565 [Burkholderia ubonensis]|nr:hypothetical protein WK72_14565 [Burkholderia ubonensis]KWH15632.1 hypothetical protein WL97_16470 [Burkholderia ubonensis]